MRGPFTDLAEEEISIGIPTGEYALWSPYEECEAAAALSRLLAADRTRAYNIAPTHQA